jgi:O-antigen ligase
MVAALPDLSWWPFWRYETHNSVLWMWLKTGVLGYLALWILLGAAVSRAAFATRSLTDPQLRVASVFCLVSIVAVLVFSYVDLGMVSPRVTVFLGSVLGIVSVIEGLQSPTAVGAAT